MTFLFIVTDHKPYILVFFARNLEILFGEQESEDKNRHRKEESMKREEDFFDFGRGKGNLQHLVSKKLFLNDKTIYNKSI